MNKKHAKIYTNGSAIKTPAAMAADMLRDLLASRELAIQLASRDIKAQYRQAFLGIIWALLPALANTSAWLFLNSTGIVTINSTTLPYPVYVFTGIILWAIFTDSVNAPLQQTSSAKAMLTKINFPREALIVSGIYQTLFNAVIKLGILIPALFFMGIVPDFKHLLLFPLALFSLILLGTTLGLLITPMGILFSDVSKGLPMAMQLFMYATPVIWPMPTSGIAAKLFVLNPLSPVIVTLRDLLTGTPPQHLVSFTFIIIAATLSLSVLWVVYRAAMPILIERMSA